MKIIRKRNDHVTLINGRSEIRVLPVTRLDDPHNEGRVVEIFVVRNVIRDTAANPISRGKEIALSFPPEKINAKEYQWHRDQGEPCQVEMRLVKPKTMRARV